MILTFLNVRMNLIQLERTLGFSGGRWCVDTCSVLLGIVSRGLYIIERGVDG